MALSRSGTAGIPLARSQGTLADIEAQVAMQLSIRDDITTISGMINDIEWMKKQLTDLTEVWSQDDSFAPLITEADSLYGSLQALEDKLLQPIAVEGDSKSFRFPNLLYSKMSVLEGDLASSADFAPNQQQREVYDVLRGQMLEEYQGELRSLLAGEVDAFNRMLGERNISRVIAPVEGGR